MSELLIGAQSCNAFQDDKNMNADMRIGAIVGTKDLMIIKSILSLHPEQWEWVTSSRDADIWIVDFAVVGPHDIINACCAIGLIKDDKHGIDIQHTLSQPIRAVEFSNLLDEIIANIDFSAARKKQSKIPEKPQPVIVKEPVEDINPWQGCAIMLTQEPNYSQYPITAELMIWIEAMLEQPVSFDDLYEDLEYDRELLIAVLNDAAHHGHLTDGDQVIVAEYIQAGNQGGLSKLWSK